MPFMYTILVAGIINLILSGIVFISGVKNKKNITLSIFILNLSMWNIFLFCKLYYGRGAYTHILYATISLLPLTSYYFVRYYIKKTEAFFALKITLYTFSGIFFILSLFKIMTDPIYHSILVFYLLLSFVITDMFLFAEYRAVRNPHVKFQLKYILVALTILLLLSSTDFMSVFNFLRPVMLGNIGTIIFVFIMSYVFVQKEVIPVNDILVKFFVYLILLLLLGITAYFVIYGFVGFSSVLYVKMLSAVFVVIILYKVTEEKVYRLSNKFLFLEEYVYHKLISEIENEADMGVNPVYLLKRIVDELFEMMYLSGAGIVALYGTKREIIYYKGDAESNFMKNMPTNARNHMVNIKKSGRSDIVIYEMQEKGLAVYFSTNRGQFGKKRKRFLETVLKQVKNVIDRRDLLGKMEDMQKIAFAGEVASGIAHDIRNPLSSIKGAVQYIEDSVHEEDKEYLEIIYDDINRIEHIIERFQIFAASREVMKSEVRVADFIKNVKARFKDRRLKVDNRIKAPGFLIDPILLEEIIFNIVQNAFDSYNGRDGDVYVTFERRERDMNVFVKDHGRGIDSKNKGKIFAPFFTTRSNGIGLGLSITKKMVDACGGSIEYGSNESGGTIFKIKLENVW